jgi:hypothetical protein
MNAEALLFHMLKGGVGKRTRDEIGACIARALRGKKEPANDNPEVLESLRNTGFSAIPPIFTAQQIESICLYLLGNPTIYYNVSPAQDGSLTHNGQRFAEWPQEVISACPEFAAAAHDPKLLRVAEAYLEAPPVITILTAWWSYPSSAPLGGMQHFHHDRDDFRCLKLFVYLTDVTEETGPHQYVDGTHETAALDSISTAPEFWAWLDRSHRKSDADVAERFWFPRTITGPAGSTFLEDTRGLHRGVPPVSAPRLAFEICYTMLPKSNASYRPIPWQTSCEATRLFYGRKDGFPFKQI